MSAPRRSARNMSRPRALVRAGFGAAALAGVFGLVAGCSDKSHEDATQAPVVKGASVVFPDGSPQLAAFASEPVEVTKPITHNLTGRLTWD